MTQSEYETRREKILKAMAAPQSMATGDKSFTNRSIADLQRALGALDAEWERSQATSTARIGRLYISGEGR